jgi:hypothetical protein
LGDHYLPSDLKAYFQNCIVYGSLENEIDRDQIDDAVFDYTFDHCNMKLADSVDLTSPHNISHFIEVQKNQDPQFVDISYEVDNLPPAVIVAMHQCRSSQ